MDLYRELKAVTPDSFQYLLHDLFETNTFWELERERATAQQTEGGTWQVTLAVRARARGVPDRYVSNSLRSAASIRSLPMYSRIAHNRFEVDRVAADPDPARLGAGRVMFRNHITAGPDESQIVHARSSRRCSPA